MQWLECFLFFIWGTVTGSFLNVCILRIPRGLSVVAPRSYCPQCGTRLPARDLVPLVSYCLLRGRCRFCSLPVSKQYPAVELITGLLFAAAAWRFGVSIEALFAAVLFSVFVAVSVIDIYYGIIPDGIILWALVLGILSTFYPPGNVYGGLLGFILGGGLLFLVAVISRGGMGGGDIKLAAVAGIYLGWQKTLFMLFAGFMLGSLFGMALVILQRKSMQDAVPFGPFLAAGGTMSLLWGDPVWSWYLTFFN